MPTTKEKYEVGSRLLLKKELAVRGDFARPPELFIFGAQKRKILGQGNQLGITCCCFGNECSGLIEIGNQVGCAV